MHIYLRASILIYKCPCFVCILNSQILKTFSFASLQGIQPHVDAIIQVFIKNKNKFVRERSIKQFKNVSNSY